MRTLEPLECQLQQELSGKTHMCVQKLSQQGRAMIISLFFILGWVGQSVPLASAPRAAYALGLSTIPLTGQGPRETTLCPMTTSPRLRAAFCCGVSPFLLCGRPTPRLHSQPAVHSMLSKVALVTISLTILNSRVMVWATRPQLQNRSFSSIPLSAADPAK